MATGEILSVEPMELQFPFELNKQIPCTMQLTNKTDRHVAFKVKTTNPKKYCVRPNTGFVSPRSSCDVLVTMQAQKEAPRDMQCKDKFLVQSVVISGGSPKDITPEMFSKESGKLVEECKLRVTYVPPPTSPSPIQKGVEEDLATTAQAILPDSGTLKSEFTYDPRVNNDHEDNSVKDKVLIAKLTQERDSFIQQNNKLLQELELLRREAKTSKSGFPLIYVILVGLVALLLGYLIKKT